MGNTSVKPHLSSRHKKQVHWRAADRPSPPGKPQLVSETEITPDVVTIRWDPPRYDGGSPITGYLVEHRRYGSPHWVRATPLLVRFNELSLSGLEPGWRYQFRVSAENAVGLSIPGELSELLTVTLQRSAITVPRFVDELIDTVALENEKVEFSSNFLGQPGPKISWFKDGFEIFSSRRIRILTENNKSILTIHQSSLSDEGEIKCTATNKAGHASTKAKLILEAPPSIRLPRQYEDGLLFELGEVIRLKVSVAGRPSPLIFWSHNNNSIKSDDHYEIESTDKYSSVRIQKAERYDRGEYQIKSINKLGEANASFLVTVTDKPAPPGQARVIMTLGRSVTLSWNIPTDDGGCKIGNYIVEYFRMGWDVWLKAATCRQLTTTIGDLIEGSEYKFRVKAESPYGISEPSEESDVIFIPDPKRGILVPSRRSKSQPRDIDTNDNVTKLNVRKPRSASSTRPEVVIHRQTTPVHFYDGSIPIRPARSKIKSPSITPETSPTVNRRITSDTINKTIFDHSSMARDLAYGSPEIKIQKIEYISDELDPSQKWDELPKVNKSVAVSQQQKFNDPSNPESTNSEITNFNRRININPNKVVNNQPTPSSLNTNIISANLIPNNSRSNSSTHNENDELEIKNIPKIKTPSPKLDSKKYFPSPSPLKHSKNRSPSPLRLSKSRSPSPNHSRKDNDSLQFPKCFNEKTNSLSNSSEFMLVLLPENKNYGRKTSDAEYDFDEIPIPPPLSLSAPELGAEELMFQPLRVSVSSSELLHEHAMARFYEALLAEEAERGDVISEEFGQKRSVDVPKIQINSKDEQVSNLERNNSIRRRFSGGLIVPQKFMWNQRRHSLRNSAETADIPENNLRKFPALLDSNTAKEDVTEINTSSENTVDKRKLSLEDKKQIFLKRQRSLSEEREEEEFERVRAKMAHQKKDKKKEVIVAQEEEWDEIIADEPVYEESLSESESDFSEIESSNNIHSEERIMIDEEEQMYPNFNQRKIKTDKINNEPFEILTKPNPLPDPNFIPKPILKRRVNENIPDKSIRNNLDTNNLLQHSRSKQSKNTNKEIPNNIKYMEKRPFSLFSQANSSQKDSGNFRMKKRGRSPINPLRRVSAAAEISGLTAASVGLPQPAKPPSLPPIIQKKAEEEIKVVVDHYGDIVKSYGQKSRSIPKVYLNSEDLKAAAETNSDDDLRSDSTEDLFSTENSSKYEEEQEIVSDQSERRPSFIEASSALLKSVKQSVAAVFVGEEIDDDVIPPEEEIIPLIQRRSSSQSQIIKRRSSKSLNKLELPKTQRKSSGGKLPCHGENWSNLRTPSPSPQGRISPTPMRRNSLIAPVSQTRRTLSTTAKPKVRESTTQTPPPKYDVLIAAEQQALTAKAELKVRTTVDYITDLAMFLVACWLYLFQNELLAIPVLLVMVYRQLKEEIRKKLPVWMFGTKKTKRK